MVNITIPKTFTRVGDLVLIPKRELEALIKRANLAVSEKDVLQWSKEARVLKRAKKLPLLTSLRTI
ncbi:MAG: hypothetical protein RL536_647 [Candidatus Parcubacteria bacterium]|jgi:hypothetical protein